MSKKYNNTILIGRINSLGQLTIENKKDCHINFDIKSITIVNGKEKEEFQSVVAYNKTARLVAKHMKQGDLLCVEGKLNSDTKSIDAEHITFLSSRKQDEISIEKNYNML